MQKTVVNPIVTHVAKFSPNSGFCEEIAEVFPWDLATVGVSFVNGHYSQLPGSKMGGSIANKYFIFIGK